jgi:hypothetical protein
MMGKKKQQPTVLLPEIRRGPIEFVAIYEVTESELDLLAQGSTGAVFLNFAVFLLSVAASFLIALLTTTIESPRTFTIFVVLTSVGSIGGLILLILWWRSYRSTSELLGKIKARLLPDLETQTANPTLPA